MLAVLMTVSGGVLGAAPADASWSIQLDVSSDLQDEGGVTLGATPSSASGLDAFDEPHPPALPRHFLDLVREHRRDEPGWAGQALPVMRYRAEYVAPLDTTPRVYELFLETDAPRRATVTWNLAPDEDLTRHHAVLVDTETGARADLWSQSSLDLDLEAGRRTLRLELTPGRVVPATPRVAFHPAGPARNVAGWNDNLTSTLAGAALVDASSQFGGGFAAQLALDDNVATRWASANGSNTNQSLTVALPGERSRRIHRVRLVNAHGSANQATRSFEVRASNTTSADAAFTTVLTGVAADLNGVQEFTLPTPVEARFIRFVALDNHGSPCCVSVRSFEAISDDESGVPLHGASPSYSSAASAENRPEAMLDGIVSTAWRSASGQAVNQHVVVRLAGENEPLVDRVRVLPSATAADPEAVRHFEVWTSSRLDGGFVRLLEATTANTDVPQEFPLSVPTRARFVRFVALDTHGVASSVKVAGLEVVTAGSDGHELSARSTVVSFSSQFGEGFGPPHALDLNPSPPAWVAANGQTTNQFLTVALPEDRSWRVDRVTLQGRTDAATDQTPRDFEVQVSTRTADPSAFTTVFAGTMRKSSAMQHFQFSPVEARYVRLLLKNNHGGSLMGLQVFWIASPEVGSVVTRLVDASRGLEGPLTSWQWELGDGATAASRDVAHTFAAPGTYPVSLTVEDSTGLRGTASRTYRAVSAPISDFELSPMPVAEGVSTTFRDLSTDPAGLAHRAWDFGDAQRAGTTQATVNHAFDDQGTYTVTLHATNTWGATSVATHSVEVSNRPPHVDAGPELKVLLGDNAVLHPSVSDSAADAATLTCQWDFGDGQTQTITSCTAARAALSRVYAAPGAYTATLTVTDKDGASASDTVRVSIYPPRCAQRGGPYLEFPYCGPYSLANLGSVPGVPFNYTGLVFKADDPNTLLISGAGIQATGAIYSIPVVRDAEGQVTGFSGTATKHASVPFIDGGLVYGPGGVLFTARWPLQELAQFAPGSTSMDKRILLPPLGMSDVSLNFVPPGFPGQCGLKLVNFFDSRWWSTSVVPDGTGTYNLGPVKLATRLPLDGPEHLLYVPADSPVFENFRSLLAMEFRANRVSVYRVDDTGDPLADSARPFVSELPAAESATVDPLTGDVLIAEAQANGRVRVVRGFAASSRGVTLDAGPGQATVGSPRGVTVTVTDGRGRPRPAVPVSLAVVSGPNAGVTGSCASDSSCRTDTAGQVRFQYVGASAGTDSVRAAVEGATCGAVISGTASVEWVENRPPVAQSLETTTPEDTPLPVQLSATDPDGGSLSYTVVTPPAHGVLSGTAPSLTYTPAPDFHGTDSFTWMATDGTADSNEATVSLTVQPVNDAPESQGRMVETKLNEAVSFTLSASDVDSEVLTYQIVTPPSHGTLQGAGPTVTYTPVAGYHGPDAFTFRVHDGQIESNVATVAIIVTPAATTLDCGHALADKPQLWPPNHKLKPITILGVTDASGRPLSAVATAIRQDEPVDGLGDGDTSPDATLQPLQVRAERASPGDGRIYEIEFVASDDHGGTCTGKVTICVPHSQGEPGEDCVDSEVRHDSTHD